jgi:hypothetical protein
LTGERRPTFLIRLCSNNRFELIGRGRAIAPRCDAWSDLAEPFAENRVPSLIRFLFVIGILAGIVFACMVALVAFVEPQPREMTQTILPNRLNSK